jgi:hypothetical protein
MLGAPREATRPTSAAQLSPEQRIARTMCGARFERTGLEELPEEVPEEVLLAAAQGDDPLARRLARSLLERDQRFEQVILLMDTEDL